MNARDAKHREAALKQTPPLNQEVDNAALRRAASSLARRGATQVNAQPNSTPLSNVAYVYDGSTEGLLSAIFLAYSNHEDPNDIVREGVLQPRLDQSLVYVETNTAHAERVRKGILRKSNSGAWDIILDASLSDEPQTGTAVYQLVKLVMARPAIENRKLGDQLAHPVVGPVIKLHRSVRNERHYMQQFLRFEHFEGDLWFARCNPKANVVPLLMDWFSGRFNTQRFVIYDEVHDIAGIYDGTIWYLAETSDVRLPLHAQDEAIMQAAWKGFYHALSIPARYHPELRRQFMPKRFWKNILEVSDEPHSANRRNLNGATETTLPSSARSFPLPKINDEDSGNQNLESPRIYRSVSKNAI